MSNEPQFRWFESHTQARTHAEDMRVWVPSSPRYLVKTFEPNEKPRPNRRALGYRWVMYLKACLVSSV